MMTYEQFLLNKIAEEAAEIAQIALKSAQFGLLEKHPDLKENNAQRIYAELDDLAACVKMLNNSTDDFEYYPNRARQVLKADKVDKYANYSIELGKVERPIHKLNVQNIEVKK